MRQPKHLWRGLFFITLIIALCGGLALPIVSTSARAAPPMQGSVVAPGDIVISEFRFRGSGGGNDEFVEFYNRTNSTIDLSGWKVKGSNNNATPSIGIRFTFPNGTLLNSGQYFLLGNQSFTDVAADDLYDVATGITSDGGIAITLPDDTIIDQVGIGVNSAFKETNVLPELTTDQDRSYERELGGASDSCQDTGDNLADFQLLNPSNPQNKLSQRSLCGVVFSPADLTATAVVQTETAAVNATATSAAITGTASAVNATATSVALTGTPTNTPITPTITNTPTIGSANSIVISEFRTRGPGGADDEFVEIYNPTTNAVDISGWVLSASNSTGTVQTRATIPAATLLRSGQYYLFAHNNYVVPSGGATPNLRYGTSIANDGGIALVNPINNQIIDEVGMHDNSFYQEGTHLDPLTGTSNGSYERKNGGSADSCVDTGDNDSDFSDSNSGTVHNYSSPLSLCGTARPAPSATVTLITGDTPDPSATNGNVTVSVRVTGGTTTPSGLVSITGANTNCTITLNATGTGSCIVKFTTNGAKTLTAIYLGDNTHASSNDTEPHQVGTTAGFPTPTRVPATLAPPPPLIGINEFVPRPGHDWNNDGVINTGDEYIELINHGVIDVDLSGYSLDDEVNIGSAPYRLPAVVLKPGERRVFYASETGLLLSDGGDGVRLLKPNGQLGDAYNYRVVRFPDQSYCRLPDNGGLDDWNQNCFPTPGLQNSLSGSTVNPPTSGDAENLCPIADTLPADFVYAECVPFGSNIWNAAYWDRDGWYGERFLPQSPGKWNVFVD